MKITPAIFAKLAARVSTAKDSVPLAAAASSTRVDSGAGAGAGTDTFSRLALQHRPGSAFQHALPDLGRTADSAPIADGTKAAGALHTAQELERLEMFPVADRLASLFLTGMLPISTPSGEGSAEITGPASDDERHRLLVRVLSAPAADDESGS